MEKKMDEKMDERQNEKQDKTPDEKPRRLLDSLPAVYRAADQSGELERLLGVFEAILLGQNDRNRPGIEEEIDGLARHFAPLPNESGAPHTMCPDRFLPWLAGWVAFTPHALFAPAQLRRIIAGIVPLYGRRGTRGYLERLLRLCFDEIVSVDIVDAAGPGLRLGRARVGQDSVLARDSPFWFRVVLELRAGMQPMSPRRPGCDPALDERVRAMIDFAKPAHTAYELTFRTGAAP